MKPGPAGPGDNRPPSKPPAKPKPTKVDPIIAAANAVAQRILADHGQPRGFAAATVQLKLREASRRVARQQQPTGS